MISLSLLIFSGGSSLLIRGGEGVAGVIDKKKFSPPLPSPHVLRLVRGGEGGASLDSPLNLLPLI